MTASTSFFQRFLLPGLVFKAVVIGGGYATGRELVEFFLPAGPAGGVLGMLLAMAIWSAVCAVGFAFAHSLSVHDYRGFFRSLLGPFWRLFEVAYLLFLVLILAVVSAAAGAIGAALFGWPVVAGTLILMAAVAGVASFGNAGVERVFPYTSALIYIVYALFLALALTNFGDRIPSRLALDVPIGGWATGGVVYASYNVVAMIAVLPFVRHLTSRRDALIAGALSGPLAMLPALMFFLCMIAFYPEIGAETLPSDFLLQRMNAPWFHMLFQLMIFMALLETAVGVINAFNERIGTTLKARNVRLYSFRARFLVVAALLVGSGFVAARFGLVTLIAKGYGAFGYVMLAILVAPLLTIGTWKLLRTRQ